MLADAELDYAVEMAHHGTVLYCIIWYLRLVVDWTILSILNIVQSSDMISMCMDNSFISTVLSALYSLFYTLHSTLYTLHSIAWHDS